MWRC
ncbi:hypothetical protein LINPERPRIM_LOCUS38301 [Linum perenne]